MKRVITIAIIAIMAMALTACVSGNIDNVKITEWKKSKIYTDKEINSAIKTAKSYFAGAFDGCTMTNISYAGDEAADEFRTWAKQYKADEAIVLYSSFDVGSSGGDGSLEPNSTYDDWNWILVRNNGGAWKHVDHGY